MANHQSLVFTGPFAPLGPVSERHGIQATRHEWEAPECVVEHPTSAEADACTERRLGERCALCHLPPGDWAHRT